MFSFSSVGKRHHWNPSRARKKLFSTKELLVGLRVPPSGPSCNQQVRLQLLFIDKKILMICKGSSFLTSPILSRIKVKKNQIKMHDFMLNVYD